MQKIKITKLIFVATFIITSMMLTSCFKNDNDSTLGDPEDALSTGLCNNAWVIDSIGNADPEANQYEGYTFNYDGTGTHTGYNETTKKIETISFKWSSYMYNNPIHMLSMTFEGYSYPASLYYRVMENGTLRVVGATAYYEFKPKGMSEAYFSTTLTDNAWTISAIGGTATTNAQYEGYQFESDGSGVHTKYSMTSGLREKTDFTWKGYAMGSSRGVLEIYYDQEEEPELYKCKFVIGGKMQMVAKDSKTIYEYSME